ncbi:MAG: ADP-ribosylglycohydrolase family protein [Halioglobus sp.]
MLIRKKSLQQLVKQVLRQRVQQGCDLDIDGFTQRIEAAADSYDALYALALELRSPDTRPDWTYSEPLDWSGICEASPLLDLRRSWQQPDLALAAENVESAFLGSLCGCMLGKPIEVDPTLEELRAAGTACGEWPLEDYVSEAFLGALGRRHESAGDTVREALNCAVADDDIHYSLIGMLLLEEFGDEFEQEQLARLWAMNMPPLWTWGAERSALLGLGLEQHHVLKQTDFSSYHDVLMLNPGDESCGAMIRVDAYGYACPGNPDLAAWLAFKDASLTHTRTGVYGAMFVAALIALCHTAGSDLRGNARLELVELALKRIPARSRLAAIITDSLDRVTSADNWQEAYQSIHGRYQQYTHCQMYQEIGTLINTLKFAESVGQGICIQVSQGNDTDSFGATAGSVLGCLLGPGHLEQKWLAPLNNRIAHGLCDLHEYEMSTLAARMKQLPALVYWASTQA